MGERTLITAWLAFWGLVVGLLGGVGLGLNGAEEAVDAVGARWTRRVDRGERMVRDGRYAVAAHYLQRLDAEFPAVFVKHRLDRDRERLLGLLGRCHRELERKGRTLETFQKLVDFDPRNWNNHFQLAEAALYFSEAGLAAESYERVLEMHPTHLPSVQARAQLFYDGGLYAQAVSEVERYLDTWLLAPITLELDDASYALEVPADARPHTIELPIDLPAGWDGILALGTHGYSVEIGRIELVPAMRTGSTEPVKPSIIPRNAPWQPVYALQMGVSRFAAQESGSRVLCVEPGALPRGATRARIALTVFKSFPADLWALTEQSYRNALDLEGLDEARDRVVVGGCLEAGSIFAR